MACGHVNSLATRIIRDTKGDHTTGHNEDRELLAEEYQMFLSLLGGLSWTTQTRGDISVFVGYLQRHVLHSGVRFRYQTVSDSNRRDR